MKNREKTENVKDDLHIVSSFDSKWGLPETDWEIPEIDWEIPESDWEIPESDWEISSDWDLKIDWEEINIDFDLPEYQNDIVKCRLENL